MRYEKLNPALLRVWRDYRRGQRDRLERHVDMWGVLMPESDEEPVRVIVSLHCDEDAIERLDPQWHVQVSTGSGSVRSAIVPLDYVEALAEDPAVHRLVLSRKHRVKLDAAAAAIRLRQFRDATRSTGSGVIIGIIDTGIDATHPAFAGRILSVWDQLAELSDLPDAARPKVVLPGAAASGCVDEDGHGTHVAGIAAGLDGKYCGVAPGADLVVVKTNRDDEGIKQGLRYIFRFAALCNRPAVVNLSLGTHADPHDGSDELSRFIDEQSGPGRIVCVAAGNEGDRDIHAALVTKRGLTHAIEFRAFDVSRAEDEEVASSEEEADERPDDGVTERSVLLTGWYSAGSSAISVGIEAPTGARTDLLNVADPGQAFDGEWVLGRVRVSIAAPPPNGLSLSFEVELSPDDPGDESAVAGVWKLLLRDEAASGTRVDIWVAHEKHAEFVGQHVDRSMRIGSPGGARRAFTVGNYVTRARWMSERRTAEFEDLDVGQIDPSSSDGPLRDGSHKPDVVAPGAMIVSARSSAAGVDPRLDVSPQYRIMGGTSMACPFAAGVVALILQHQPSAGPEEIRRLLVSTAAIPGKRSGRFDSRWGYGLVRVLHDESEPRRPTKAKSKRRGSRPPSASTRR